MSGGSSILASSSQTFTAGSMRRTVSRNQSSGEAPMGIQLKKKRAYFDLCLIFLLLRFSLLETKYSRQEEYLLAQHQSKCIHWAMCFLPLIDFMLLIILMQPHTAVLTIKVMNTLKQQEEYLLAQHHSKCIHWAMCFLPLIDCMLLIILMQPHTAVLTIKVMNTLKHAEYKGDEHIKAVKSVTKLLLPFINRQDIKEGFHS
ncbi:hypothetical protein F7725_017158 [Dissostichus mawsoni]|uniref:Uncharacterized protein n=1 Tax=Dissostichus mawsoni TaxID=36200 RepID=A0A7J5Z3M8_DISMA|nr:hypothetical protein F7725_017158 [Dissostichus mawsoni]